MHTDWKKIYIVTGISLIIFLAFFAYLWYQVLKISEPKQIVPANPATNRTETAMMVEEITSSTPLHATSSLGVVIESKEKTSSSSEEASAEFWEKLNEAESASSSYIRFVDHSVPFTPQAPFAEWDDPRQQDACEEASILMAVRYLFDEGLDLVSAKEEIIKITEFEEDKYGTYIDTSAEDTAKRILDAYFKVSNYEIKVVRSMDDLIAYIMDEYLVIAPMNGQALENPNFSPPGPEKHMLLIRGYDPGTAEFITNDPGTRKGEGYRYDEDVLFSALRDYPTGDHEPILSEIKEVILLKLNKKQSREAPLFYDPAND